MHSRHLLRRRARFETGLGFRAPGPGLKIERQGTMKTKARNTRSRSGAGAMLGLLGLAWMVCALFVGCTAQREPSTPASVTHVRIEGALDVGTLGLLRRAFAHAAANDHERLVIELDTPGGEIELMWQIGSLIDERGSSDLVVVAWVNDKAISAGVFVALACDEIYMTETATIGDSMPIQIGPGGMPTELPLEGNVREKMMSSLRADFRSMAEKRGRPGELAEAMIDPEIEIREIELDGVRQVVNGKQYDDARERGDEVVMLRTLVERGELLTLTSSEAIELRFVDGRAADFDVLLEKIGLAGAQADRLQRKRSEDVLAFLDRLAPVLLGLGVMLAFMELKSPGFGLPGILAIACFATLIVGRYLTGLADIPQVLMVAVGIALMAVELFLVPGTLWAGITGGLLVIFGLVSASVGPGLGFSSAMQRKILLDTSFSLAVSTFAGLVGALLLSRFLPQTPVLRGLVLDPDRDAGTSAMRPVPVFEGEPDVAPELAHVGAQGIVRTALRPVGKVVLDGADELEFEARAAGQLIDAGQRVRVVEVREGRLVVEPLG